MTTEVRLPQRGMGMSEAIVVEWHVAEGDHVNEGDILVEYESSKVTEEIFAPVNGVVSKILCEIDDEVEVGEVLVIIAGEDEDVEADDESDAPAKAEANVEPDVDMPAGEEPEAAVEEITATGIRRRTAKRMMESLHNSAQLTLETEVDVTATVEKREELKTETNMTYTDILVKIVAEVLRDHPMINAVWDEETIRVPAEVNIGVAVALDEGLIVPVVHDADTKPLDEIHEELAALADKAHSDLLVADELSDGTFTITNLGMYRVDHFTPILNPPQTGILGVGRIRRKPAEHDGEVALRSMLGLSLTFDHRIVDGAPAAAFLDALCERLELADF